MKVIYPVLFYEEKEGGYSVFVPDLERALNCSASTCGSTLEEAMEMAEDLIAGLIIDEMEADNKIPKASKHLQCRQNNKLCCSDTTSQYYVKNNKK